MVPCTRCGQVKAMTEFYPRDDRPSGRTSACKACTRKNNNARDNKRDSVGTSSWERRREYFRQYQESGQRKAKVNARYRELRDAIISGYGGKCCKCGFTDRRALQVDHVNGNGRRERKELKSSATIWRKIIRAGFPPEYQILCANCNSIKMYEGREFPGWAFHSEEVA